MKKIDAYIRPEKLDELKEHLEEMHLNGTLCQPGYGVR